MPRRSPSKPSSWLDTFLKGTVFVISIWTHYEASALGCFERRRIRASPDCISFSRTCGVTKKTLLLFHKEALLEGHVWPVKSIVHSCSQLNPDEVKQILSIIACGREQMTYLWYPNDIMTCLNLLHHKRPRRCGKDNFTWQRNNKHGF